MRVRIERAMEVGFRSALIIQRAQDAPQRKYSRVAGGGGGVGGFKTRAPSAHLLRARFVPFQRPIPSP
jgi:hypothetical protein